VSTFDDIPRPGPDDAYCTLGDLLRERGWTRTLVDAILGQPDKLAVNPRGYRSPMQLFARERVLEAETMPADQAGRAKALARAKAKQRAASPAPPVRRTF